MTENTTPATADNAALLKQYETDIKKGQQSFFTMAMAVHEIRHKQLFKPDFDNFTQYFDIRWDMSPGDVTRYTDAARVLNVLKSRGFTKLPVNEGQARVFKDMSDDDIEKFWRQAVEESEKSRRKITAKLISQLVNPVAEIDASKALAEKAEAEAGLIHVDASETVVHKPQRQSVLDALLALDSDDADWVIENFVARRPLKVVA